MNGKPEHINPRLYKVSFDRGFLPLDEDPLCFLPSEFESLEILGEALPVVLSEGKIKEACLELPIPDIDLLGSLSERQAQLALMRYDFIKSGFVHGQAETPKVLPYNLAWPSYVIGKMLGKKTHILNYYSYSSCNWSRIDPDGPADVDNLKTIQRFLGSSDEDWFILIHVAVDFKEAELIYNILEAIYAAEAEVYDRLDYYLELIGDIYDEMTEIFNRVGEKAFASTYHATRKWIHPFTNVLYEGVFDKPVSYRGETGAQRPGMPTIDALLGVKHRDTVHLDAMHDYMPAGHVKFIQTVKQRSKVRDLILKEKGILAGSYNYALEAVARFRDAHYGYADNFINKQTANPVGTGLTHFMAWLKELRDETLKHRV
jgi:indoleamine 2,3-dioxygenase